MGNRLQLGRYLGNWLKRSQKKGSWNSKAPIIFCDLFLIINKYFRTGNFVLLSLKRAPKIAFSSTKSALTFDSVHSSLVIVAILYLYLRLYTRKIKSYLTYYFGSITIARSISWSRTFNFYSAIFIHEHHFPTISRVYWSGEERGGQANNSLPTIFKLGLWRVSLSGYLHF